MPRRAIWAQGLLAARFLLEGGLREPGLREPAERWLSVPAPTPGWRRRRGLERHPSENREPARGHRESFQEFPRGRRVPGTNCASLVSDASPDDGFCVSHSKFIRAAELHDRQDLCTSLLLFFSTCTPVAPTGTGCALRPTMLGAVRSRTEAACVAHPLCKNDTGGIQVRVRKRSPKRRGTGWLCCCERDPPQRTAMKGPFLKT